MTPLERQYYNQRYSAIKFRNIEWQFTFEEWVAWWGDDIVNHGPGKNQLVMARHNDIGPYHPNNVRKATVSENCSEANKGKKWSDDHRDKLRHYRTGKKQSPETRAKISASLKAKKVGTTEVTLADSLMPGAETDKITPILHSARVS